MKNKTTNNIVCVCNIIENEHITFRNVYTHNNEKRDGEFEGEHGGILWRVRREEREDRNVISKLILISKIKHKLLSHG